MKHPNNFEWEYLEQTPEVWLVVIAKKQVFEDISDILQ